MNGNPSLDDVVYDAVIVGTGLTESILSASLSWAGAKVLHLEPNDFYGQSDGSILSAKLSSLASEPRAARPSTNHASTQPTALTPAPELGDGAKITNLDIMRTEEQLLPHKYDVESMSAMAANRVIVDMTPRPLMAAADAIDLLIKTGAGHYVSFRPIDAMYLYFGKDFKGMPAEAAPLQRVPASRSDVFQSKFLTAVEKRLLMRFLKSASGAASGAEKDDAAVREGDDPMLAADTFEGAMSEARLTEKLKYFLRHAIVSAAIGSAANGGDATAEASAEAAFDAVHKYHHSLIRYGTPTPFLYSNHGSAEICEAFCRLSAVHGGTFVLRRKVYAVASACADAGPSASSEEKSPRSLNARQAVLAAGTKPVRCTRVFVSSALARPYAHVEDEASTGRYIWRSAALLSDSMFDDAVGRALAVFPKGTCGNTDTAVRVLQVDSSAEVCPSDKFVLYAETAEATESPADLHTVLSVLRSKGRGDTEADPPQGTDHRSCVLWSITYACAVDGAAHNEAEWQSETSEEEKPVLVQHVPPDLTGRLAIAEARRCFEYVRSPEEFFQEPVEPQHLDAESQDHDAQRNDTEEPADRIHQTAQG